MLFVQKYSHQNVSNCKILASLPEERERERERESWFTGPGSFEQLGMGQKRK